MLFAVSASGLFSLCVIGLPLAIAGIFRPLIVAIPILILWAALARYGLRVARQTSAKATVASWVAVATMTLFVIFTASHSSEHLLTNRDPGVYVITGKWLSDNGDLLYHTGLPDDIAVTSERSRGSLPQGVYPGPDGFAYFQFQHAPAIVLATGHWVGGDWLMLRIMAVVAGVGLLGIFLLARELAGPVFGLLPVVAAAVHPALVFVAKDAYSEPLAMVFVLGAMVTWLRTPPAGRPRYSLMVGLILGATSMVRIDSWLIGIGFLTGVAYLLLADDSNYRPSRSEVVSLLVGFGLTSGLGLLDLILRSPQYFADLSSLAVPMMLVFAVVAAGTLALAFAGAPSEQFGRRVRRFVSGLTAAGIAVGGLVGLFLRPRHLIARGAARNEFVAGLQAREGVDVEPLRTYAEMSLEWFARYQGYLPVALGLLAVALAAFLVLRRRGDRRTPLLLVLLAVGTVYLWRPSITPDHFWAMRRFVPVVLPLAFVFTAWGARVIVRRCHRREWVSLSMGAVLILAITNSLVTGWPVNAVRTQVSVADAIDKLCSQLPADAVVLFDGPTRTLAGALRTTCGVPTTAATEPGIADRVLAAGMNPIRLSSDVTCSVTIGSATTTYELPERTLTRSPQKAQSETLSVYLSRAQDDAGEFHVPGSAEAVLFAEVDTTWAPKTGSSLIAVMGNYREGVWLEYRPSGRVEIWVTTDEGNYGVVTSPRIDDGRTRTVGGYLLGGVLHGICGGQEIDSRTVPGQLRLAHDEIDLKPVTTGEHGNQPFEGSVTITQARAGPSQEETD